MPRFSANVLLEPARSEEHPSAFGDCETVFFTPHDDQIDTILSRLCFSVIREPQNLLAHWQRIFFCYQHVGPEPLYAALLDLLIVLNHKGQAFSQRLIQGSRSKLDSSQLLFLKQAGVEPLSVPGNRYSLFSQDIIGKRELVVMNQLMQAEHDYLALAEDFIEYSQIEEAMSVLESGLSLHPERQDLQAALLEIYRSAQHRQRFTMQYDMIKSTGAPLIDTWQVLADSFSGKAS